MTILTEKKSVAENYIKALKLEKKENGWYVSKEGKINLTYAAGHLYTLYEPEDYNAKDSDWYQRKLPIKPNPYKYKPIDSKKSTRTDCEKVLKNAVLKNDEIVIATDPDREGEVIARIILRKINADKNNTTRIWCCEGLDENQIVSGLKARKSDSEYDYLADMGEYQKKADWLFGINLSTAYSILNNGETYSVGRCQTAVLREIYQREGLIKLHLVQKYYELQVELANGTFAYLQNPQNKKITFKTREEVQKVINRYKGLKTIRVNDIQEKSEKELPPKLYDLAGVQIDGFKHYNIEVDKVLEIAQKLYNEMGKISYPRTDSVVLSDTDVKQTKDLYIKIKESYKELKNPDEEKINENNKRLFDSKGITGHHGIIPSNVYKNDGTLEWKIYDLIARRFLMSGMGSFEKKNYKVYLDTKIGNEIFVSEGYEIENLGWKEAEVGFEDKSKKNVFEKGYEYEIKGMKILEKETEPPKHYTQGTLIAFMRNPGNSDEEGISLSSIGTEATQASIVKTLFERGYVRNKGKHIEITEKGIRIVEQIMDNPVLEKNTQVITTTQWERLNKEDPVMFLKAIEAVTEKAIEGIKEKMESIIKVRELGECPNCGGKIVKGKFGYYCTNYKEKACENNINYHVMGNDFTDEMVESFLTEKKTPVMDGVKKDGSNVKFYFAIDENGKFVIRFIENSEKVADCPLCGSEVKETKMVYKCQNKECNFFMWKNTSGITFTREMAGNLIKGERIKASQTKKDGSKVNVSVRLNDVKNAIEIIY